MSAGGIDNMIVYAEYPASRILPLLTQKVNGEILTKLYVLETEHGPFDVKLGSLRLQCFSKSHFCVECGIAGSLFRLEQHASDVSRPHLNMYAEKDGKWILMTKDHIVPKSKGGPDHPDNLQTMCYVCNEAKGDKL